MKRYKDHKTEQLAAPSKSSSKSSFRKRGAGRGRALGGGGGHGAFRQGAFLLRRL